MLLVAATVEAALWTRRTECLGLVGAVGVALVAGDWGRGRTGAGRHNEGDDAGGKDRARGGHQVISGDSDLGFACLWSATALSNGLRAAGGGASPAYNALEHRQH